MPETKPGDTTPAATPATVDMVPKSELTSLQDSLKSKEANWSTSEGALRAELARTKANSELVTAKLALVEPFQAKYTTLEKEFTDLKVKHTDVSTKYLTTRRNVLATMYGISPDLIKDKDHTALDTFEEALKALGRTPNPTRPDTGGAGGGSSGTPKTPLEWAKDALAEARKREAKV